MLLGILAILASGITTDQNTLPKRVEMFISTYYPSSKISTFTMERDVFRKSYKVILTNGVCVDFDNNCEWRRIKGKGESKVAMAAVPAKIDQYLIDNYPENNIIQIERDKRSMEVKLTKEIYLQFNNNGDLIDR